MGVGRLRRAESSSLRSERILVLVQAEREPKRELSGGHEAKFYAR